MKTAFAAACLMGMTLGHYYGLADDEGLDEEHVTGATASNDDKNDFSKAWNVPDNITINVDSSDSKGFQI